jgi:hypothetical protein
VIPLALVLVALAFVFSAAAGLGGSLVLVPAMALLLGPREGISLAALLLALNNVAKVIAYRQTIPLRASAGVLLMTMVGASIGASTLVRIPEAWVHVAIVAGIAMSLYFERRPIEVSRWVVPPVMALAAGALSGFSGTSGPLKGMAIRNLKLDRMHFVGASSVVSLAGDGMKVAVFFHAALISDRARLIVVAALPLMPLAAWLGRLVNRRCGERPFRRLFWLVMGGYTVRLLTG